MQLIQKQDQPQKMPVFFVGHGSPINAIQDNSFTRSLLNMGKSLPDLPKAILVISAHWLSNGVYVNSTPFPATIHDFYGFPEELFQVEYLAPGAPDQAKKVMELLPGCKEDAQRGLDHGAWTILKHMFPSADIPVFQLSLDYYQPLHYHMDLAKRLLPLRKTGVLIIGSGNIVHNIRLSVTKEDPTPYDWAIRFDEWVKTRLITRDTAGLLEYKSQGTDGMLAVPTVDHYLPMLYSLALMEDNETIRFTYEEIWSGMSMRCFEIR